MSKVNEKGKNFGTNKSVTKIKFIKDIIGEDKDGVETLRVTRRRNRRWSPPIKSDGKFVESAEPEFVHIPWVKNQVIEMSEASCQKYIDAGLAVAVPAETEETEIKK